MKFKNELEKIENTYFGKNKCIIIGNPVEHSLSPAMHNIAYKNCNIDDKFIFDKITVKEEELEEFIFDLKDINKKTNSFVGLTCTMPHKQNIIKYLDEIKNEAKIIGAVNSVLIKDNKFIGYNTDWYGVERPFMERCINLTNKKVAIIGAGGASRSAIYTFKKNNSVVNIFNRTKEKADLLAKEFNCNSYNLQDMDVLESSDIIINTTKIIALIGFTVTINKKPNIPLIHAPISGKKAVNIVTTPITKAYGILNIVIPKKHKVPNIIASLH